MYRHSFDAVRARILNGPHDPKNLYAKDPVKLAFLRWIKWSMLSNQERGEKLVISKGLSEQEERYGVVWTDEQIAPFIHYDQLGYQDYEKYLVEQKLKKEEKSRKIRELFLHGTAEQKHVLDRWLCT